MRALISTLATFSVKRSIEPIELIAKMDLKNTFVEIKYIILNKLIEDMIKVLFLEFININSILIRLQSDKLLNPILSIIFRLLLVFLNLLSY